jgi:hypothetical protein
LNHMNGRVQDAITGRFLSPDPHITQPLNPQNYNRYSYVNNNPLSFMDPTGFDIQCDDCSDVGSSYSDSATSTVTIEGQRDGGTPPIAWSGSPDGSNGTGNSANQGAGARSKGSQTPGVLPPSKCTRAGCVSYTQVCSDGACSTKGFYYPALIEAGWASIVPTGLPVGPSGPGPEESAPQGNNKPADPNNPNTFKTYVCSIFAKFGYGTAGFTLGDGIGGRVTVTFTNSAITGFVGLGLGAGQSMTFTAGLQGGVESGSQVGFRTFASANAALGPVAIAGEYAGGTNGVDGSLGGGVGEGLSVATGVGVSFIIAEGDPKTSCQ